jgi:SAM-dependent methyltransferase
MDWPPINGIHPTWTGRGFLLGDRACAVLDYEAGTSGWSDELTEFHEATAGEGTHPIDVASRRSARAAFRRHLRAKAGDAVLLEAGCSTGFLLQELVRDWPQALVLGSDYILGPLTRLADRVPTLPLLRFDLVKCPLPSGSVDGVVLLNVLEHVEDDAAAIAQVARVLRPGGVAVIEVPAGPQLFDVYDKYLRHFRRYRLADVCSLLEQAGLRVVKRSHLGFFVYPAFAWVKRRNRRLLDAPEDVQRAAVERSITTSARGPMLRWATALEERLGRRLSYPVGIRCVVTAVKPRA